MKYLVVGLYADGYEKPFHIYDSLDSAILFIKEKCFSPYCGDSYRIYSLSSPLTVRYLDNKIFID